VSGPVAVSAFAPATVANLGPGLDVLGLALAEPGDRVTAQLTPGQGVTIAAVTGDGGALPLDPKTNTAGIAAEATLAKAGVATGVTLTLHKGMPIGSGLGSSAASAAAAAYAVNILIGSPLRKVELVGPCLAAEAAVAGRHADNVAPALLGGLILVRSLDPLDLVRLPLPEGLVVAVVTPKMELSTRAARAALPKDVPLASLVRNTAQIAALVSACYSGDLGLLARSLTDAVATPARAPLIPGCAEVIEAALNVGALGSSISGAGPSIFALCRSERSAGEVVQAMVGAFAASGLASGAIVSPADCPGARRV
jgi:homoserine kinase